MQIEILTIGKPDKGNVKLTAIILVPPGVLPETTYFSANDTNEERDVKKLARAADMDERDGGLKKIARLHLGKAELTQEADE